MIKKFYVFAWFLLAGSVLFSLLYGQMSGLQMVAFSLAGLALVYGLALYSVITNTPDMHTE